MNWYLHKFTQFFIQFPYKKGLNSKLKYWTWLFVIRSLLFEYSNIIQYFKKDRIWIQISLFGLLLFEYSNNELFVATLLWSDDKKSSSSPVRARGNGAIGINFTEQVRIQFVLSLIHVASICHLVDNEPMRCECSLSSVDPIFKIFLYLQSWYRLHIPWILNLASSAGDSRESSFSTAMGVHCARIS